MAHLATPVRTPMIVSHAGDITVPLWQEALLENQPECMFARQRKTSEEALTRTFLSLKPKIVSQCQEIWALR